MTTTTAPSSVGYAKYRADAAKSAGSSSKDVTPSSNGSALKETDFLHLLTTQLVHQDPLNPQSDTDFAAQMAQYSSLAEMRHLNDTMSKQASFAKVSSAASLIGKSVNTTDVDAGGKAIGGLVSAVDVAPDGTITLNVGGTSVPIEHVVSVSTPTVPSGFNLPSLPVGAGEKHATNGPASASLDLDLQKASGAPGSGDVSSSVQSAVQQAAEQAARQLSQAPTQPAGLPVN